MFGTKGDPAGCWCQWYKIRGAEWRSATREELRDRLAAQLAPGPGPGLLAYDGDTPVGWCAVEPRPRSSGCRSAPGRLSLPRRRFRRRRRLVGVVLRDPARVPSSRRRGALAEAAVDYARQHGARVLEAYAVDPAARTKPPAAELFPGTVSMFLAAGFGEVARPKPHRAVMQRRLVG